MNTRMSRKSYVLKSALIAGAVGALLMAGTPAMSATIDWASWTSNGAGGVQGAMNPLGVTVSYSGELNNLRPANWNPSSTFSGGTISNAPPQSGGMLALVGGGNTVSTITFSTAVVNPVMAIWSLGSGGAPASFVFTNNEPFTIQSGGPSTDYGGSSITSSGNTVYGNEGNGTIQFQGVYSQLTWTNPQYEVWYGFTVGAPAVVPVPAAAWLFGSGLLGLVGMARRKAA